VAGAEADLVFEIRKDPGEVLRRRVRGFWVTYGRRRLLTLAAGAAVIGVVGGIAWLWVPSIGGFLVFYAAVSEGSLLVAWPFVRMRMGDMAMLRPFDHARFDLVANRSGLEYLAQGIDLRISWAHAVDVRDHDGGLLVVFDGTPSVIDIPPWCFADDDARERAKAQLASWIRPPATRP
jgi:hypothetical protein